MSGLLERVKLSRAELVRRAEALLQLPGVANRDYVRDDEGKFAETPDGSDVDLDDGDDGEIAPAFELLDSIKLGGKGGPYYLAAFTDVEGEYGPSGGRVVAVTSDKPNWNSDHPGDEARVVIPASTAAAIADAADVLNRQLEPLEGRADEDWEKGPVRVDFAAVDGFQVGAFHDPAGDLLGPGGTFVSIRDSQSAEPPDWDDANAEVIDGPAVGGLTAALRQMAGPSVNNQLSQRTESAGRPVSSLLERVKLSRAGLVRAEALLQPQVENRDYVRDGEGQFAETPGGGASVVADKLKGAGRIDLEPGERLLRSDRTRGDNGRAWLAVVEKDGKRSLRLGLGNAEFGTRRDANGPWRAAEDRSYEINEERQELIADREELENEIGELEADPNADPAGLAARRAQLDELYDADTNEVSPNGHTSILDEEGARRLRETLAKALDDGEELRSAIEPHQEEIDRLEVRRDKLRGIDRKWTGEEDAEWDRLTAEVERLEAEQEAAPGPDRPERGFWVLAEGSIPGQWADVHYEVFLDDPTVGVETKLGAIPHHYDQDFTEFQGEGAHADFAMAEADEFVRLLAKMGLEERESAGRPVMASTPVLLFQRANQSRLMLATLLNHPGKPPHTQKDHGRKKKLPDLVPDVDVLKVEQESPPKPKRAPAKSAPKKAAPKPSLAERVAGGEKSKSEIGKDHNSNKVYAVRLNDRSRAILKTTKTSEDRAIPEFDAEELGASVAHTLGLSAPEVHRSGPGEAYFAHIKDYAPQAKIGARVAKSVDYESADALRIGLLDLLIGNIDRHNENWFAENAGTPEERLIPIDQGSSFIESAERRDPKAAPFEHKGFNRPFVARELGGPSVWLDNPLSPAYMASLRPKLDALRPEFERLGRRDWHDWMLARFDVVGEHATGTVTP